MNAPAIDSVNLAADAELRRLELQRCLEEAAILPGADASTCRWLQEKLSDSVFNLVAAGQFKRGKSTLINALLGEALLPMGVVPLTSVVTILCSGKSSAARVEFRDGRRLPIELDALGDYATERGNPSNSKHVERVVIQHPSFWLAQGVRLVDTPGLGSVYEHNSDETRKYLPQADAVLFVASVDQPLSRAELDFLGDIGAYAGKIFCLLNKTDYLRPEELRESLLFSTDVIRNALGASVPVYAVSARLALEGKQNADSDALGRSGMREFESALGHFIETEKMDAWLRSIIHNLMRILAHARFGIDLESKVLTEPLEAIEASLALFHQEKQTVEQRRADYQVLLEADARRLLTAEIEPSLETFTRARQESVLAEVERWFTELQRMSSRKLHVALEERVVTEIRNTYDDWLAQEDVKLSKAFQALCSRFWSSMQDTVDDLLQRSSELFSVALGGTKAESRWSTESGFYYKFWYEPTSLKILSSSLVLALPRLIAGPLIIRRTKAMAIELIEIQAGRIRHDLQERLKKSVQDAGRRMVAQIEATIVGIESAINDGLAMRLHRTQDIESRSAQLEELRAKTCALEERVRRLLNYLPSVKTS